jgi:hypothetical protein
MRAMVVYESLFGNTGAIANAVASGLPDGLSVDLVKVTEAPTTLDPDVVLLIVGAPTHAFGLSAPRTRTDAARQGAPDVTLERIGVREWLEALDRSGGTAAATFDTRVDRPRLPGSAARAAARRLRRIGFRVVVAPASFYVKGTPGPLLAGESERAERWAASLASTALKTLGPVS